MIHPHLSAVTSRMLFPLIDGGEYTFTNGQRTKRMLVIEDDPVTINGTSYQEFRFVEDLGKEYCGYISYQTLLYQARDL